MKARVGKSKLHGRGVIAIKDIRKGEKVFTIKGRKVKFLIDSQKKADAITYNLIGIGKNTWIDPNSFGRYYNHSCDPNSGIVRKTAVATKNIKKSEEITADYSLSEADIFWHFRCNCGSKNCRKVIRSIQFLPKKIFNKYKRYVPKYFQQVFWNFNAAKFKNPKDLRFAWVGFIKRGYRV